MIGQMAWSQVLKEDVQVMDKPVGKALFTLNEGQSVYSYKPEDNWYKIDKEVYVNGESIIDSQYIRPNTPLLNKDGDQIGKTLTQIKIVEGKMHTAFRGKKTFHAIIEGYLFKTKFEEGSIPEEKVSELLNMHNRNEQIEGFKKLFEDYNFEEHKYDELVAHVYRPQNNTIREDKGFRLIVIFRGESTPYAIITNGHDVNIPKVKEEWSDGDYKVTYLYKPTDSQEKLIQDDILYTFMAL